MGSPGRGGRHASLPDGWAGRAPATDRASQVLWLSSQDGPPNEVPRRCFLCYPSGRGRLRCAPGGRLRNVRGEPHDLHTCRHRDAGEGCGQVPGHRVKPASGTVAVRRVQGDRPGVVGQACARQRKRSAWVALAVQRKGRRLGPAQQLAAEPTFAVCRVHATLVAHVVDRVRRGPGGQDAVSSHRAAGVDDHRTADGEV
jgi:hypothetical protein